MRVFDCCLLFNELDLLEIRLHTHTWADAHVIVESPRTFSNLPKPITLDVKAPRFARFAPKVRHIIADKLQWPEARGRRLGKAGRMALNGEQWEYAKRGLADAKPDDMIVLSDLDEILSAEAIERAKPKMAAGPVRFNMRLYTYALNGLRAMHWFGPVAGLAKDVLKGSLWTYRQTLRTTAPQVVGDAGWHFSSLGTATQVEAKLRAAAHTEWNRFVDDRAALAKWMAEGHVFSPSNAAANVVRYVPVDRTFPQHVLANRDRFKHLIRGAK